MTQDEQLTADLASPPLTDVANEMARIKRAMDQTLGDSEDLVSYAKEIVGLRRLHDRLAAPRPSVVGDGLREACKPFASLEVWEHIDDDVCLTRPTEHGVRISARHVRRLRAALTASIPAVPDMVAGVVVKPLEWRDLSFSGPVLWIANHAFYDYSIIVGSEPGYEHVVRPMHQGFATLDAAKAAAQADYSARIRSCLTQDPTR